MKKCDEYSGDLILYIYGELDDPEKMKLEKHIAGCAACAAELEELRVVHDAVAESITEPAISLQTSERIRWNARKTAAGFIRQSSPAITARRFRTKTFVAAAAACLLFAIVTTAYVFLIQDRPSAPPRVTEYAASTESLSWESDISEPLERIDARLARMNERREIKHKLKKPGLETRLRNMKSQLGASERVALAPGAARRARCRDAIDSSLRRLRRDMRSLKQDVGNDV